MRHDDDRLAAWCGAHHGIVTAGDCGRIGMPYRSLHRYVERRVLRELHPGVFRHASHPATFESRLGAALVAAGEGSYASGPSLMRLYGIRGAWIERPEVTVLGTRRVELTGVRVRRIDRLEPVDVRVRDGFPALAPPLGLLLLGATVPRERVVPAVHDMVFLGFTRRALLIDAAIRYRGRGRRGSVAFRKAVLSLDAKGGATQSNFELALLQALRFRGLPDPVLQHPLIDGHGKRRRLDFAWPDRLLAVETDGDRWHLDAVAQRDMAARDAALALLGWSTLRISSAEWELDPGGSVDRVATALTS